MEADTNPTVIPDETGIYWRPDIRQKREKKKKRKGKTQQRSGVVKDSIKRSTPLV